MLLWDILVVLDLVGCIIMACLALTHGVETATAWTQWIQALSAVATTVLTVGIVFVTKRQAVAAEGQRVLMEGQLAATKTAAEAALAALDRPWLAIEDLSHTWTNWVSGQGDLTAEFRIVNHGKTPAFITSVSASLFIGYQNLLRAPFGAERISQTILKFPSPEELPIFKMRLFTLPSVRMPDFDASELPEIDIDKPVFTPAF